MEYLCDEAQHDLESGIPPEEVEERLIAEGISESEAWHIVNERRTAILRTARHYGTMRVAAGGLLLTLGIVLVIAAAVTLVHRQKGPVYIFALATVCLGAGLRVTLLGGFNLWSGRE
jgi:hypothetical protein